MPDRCSLFSLPLWSLCQEGLSKAPVLQAQDTAPDLKEAVRETRKKPKVGVVSRKEAVIHFRGWQ